MKNENRPKRTGKTVKCVRCGRRHKVRPSYVGYEEEALCATCEETIQLWIGWREEEGE